MFGQSLNLCTDTVHAKKPFGMYVLYAVVEYKYIYLTTVGYLYTDWRLDTFQNNPVYYMLFMKLPNSM